MPTYDYKCDNEECGHVEEILQKGSDPFHFKNGCPKCGGVEMTRMIGVPYFAYDNISSPGHKKSSPSWMKDKLKEIKKQQPKATMNIPE